MTITSRQSRVRRRSRANTLIGVVLTALMLFPVYWMVNVSLAPTGLMRKDPPNLIPLHATFDGYRVVLREQLPYLLTSFMVGIGTVLLTLLIAAPAAYSLSKLRPRGRNALDFALLIAQMIPNIIMALGFYSVFLTTHLVNHWWGLMLADSTIAVPFGVLILTAYMSGVPDDLLQAARIDGAGSVRAFWSVVLPVSLNGVVTVSLFAFLWAWSDFVFASTLDGAEASAR